jgi:tetratricopeptide (TPR) repeat protein
LPRGDRPWFRAIAEIVAACGRRGDWVEVERWLRAAADVEAASWARSDQIACLCPGAAQLLQAGRDEIAEAIAARAEALACGPARVEPFALARIAQLGGLRAFCGGDMDAARRAYLEAIALFEAAGDQRNACLERINLGVTLAELGEPALADEALRLCLAGAERMHLGVVRGYALVNLSRVLLDQGRLDEAGQAAEQAREVGLANHSPRLAGAALTRLSMLAHHRGDVARAEAHARLAEEALAAFPSLHAGALAARARALVAQGRPAEALDAARRAMGLIEGDHYEIFHRLVRLAHAEALDAAGESA